MKKIIYIFVLFLVSCTEHGTKLTELTITDPILDSVTNEVKKMYIQKKDAIIILFFPLKKKMTL